MVNTSGEYIGVKICEAHGDVLSLGWVRLEVRIRVRVRAGCG